MKVLHFLKLMLLCWLLGTNCLAQTTEQVNFWKKAVAEKPLPEISALMADTSLPSWPKAVSAQFAGSLVGKDRAVSAEAVDLVKALHAKTKSEFNPAKQGSIVELKTYITIAAVLEKSGGYSNMLLADTLRRLAIFRVSEWLVHHSHSVAEIRELTESMSVPSVDIRSFLERFASEDNSLAGHSAAFAKITPTQNIYAALETAGLGDATSSGAQTFSQVMENPSAIGLMTRMAGTESLYNVSLKGLLVFLEKGGTYQELNPADITAFKSRMGGAEKSFKYPPLGVRYLSVSHLRSLFELHSEPAACKAFLQIALD